MTSDGAMPQFTDRMKELTLLVGRQLKAKATVHHRRKQSSGATGSADGDCGAPESHPSRMITDAYGFEQIVTPEQEEALARCAAQQERQAAKWAAACCPGEALPSEDRLKKLCRRGVPPALRKWVWTSASGAVARQAAHGIGYYREAVDQGRAASPFVHQIELDVPRTFPNCAWIQSEAGQTALRRLLLAFAHHNQHVGYCQGMNFVAAMLLLVLGHDEEAAFWVLASLIDEEKGILYQDMYSCDLSGCHVEMRSLRALLAAKVPRLASHLASLRCDMSILATDWFLCLYCTSLPAETAIRIWDALLHEGPKVLFRVALALLKMHEPALLATDNPGDLLRTTRTAAAEEYDRDELMRVAFDGVGSLPMDRIQQYRDRNQRSVDREFAQRELRANLRQAVLERGYVLTEAEADLLQGGDGDQDGDEILNGGNGGSVYDGVGRLWRGQLHGLAAVGSVLGERTKATLGAGAQRLRQLPRTMSGAAVKE